MQSKSYTHLIWPIIYSVLYGFGKAVGKLPPKIGGNTNKYWSFQNDQCDSIYQSIALLLCDVVCVHLCRVSVDILCCFEVILRYSPCFCTSSFVNSCIACIVGIHFPFKAAAGHSCKLFQSQVILLLSQSTVSAVTKPVRQQMLLQPEIAKLKCFGGKGVKCACYFIAKYCGIKLQYIKNYIFPDREISRCVTWLYFNIDYIFSNEWNACVCKPTWRIVWCSVCKYKICNLDKSCFHCTNVIWNA